MRIEPLKTLPPLRSGGQSAVTQKQKTKMRVSPPFIIVSVTAAAFSASLAKIPQIARRFFWETLGSLRWIFQREGGETSLGDAREDNERCYWNGSKSSLSGWRVGQRGLTVCFVFGCCCCVLDTLRTMGCYLDVCECKMRRVLVLCRFHGHFFKFQLLLHEKINCILSSWMCNMSIKKKQGTVATFVYFFVCSVCRFSSPSLVCQWATLACAPGYLVSVNFHLRGAKW